MSETEGFHLNPFILHTFPPHVGGKMSETEGFYINPSILHPFPPHLGGGMSETQGFHINRLGNLREGWRKNE